MQDTEMFNYLAAFVTIILALALGDMVQSVHRLLAAGRLVAWDAVPIGAAVFVFLSVLSEFFSLWSARDVHEFGFYQLVVMVAVPAALALAACASLPDRIPEVGLNLRSFYVERRRYLFSVLGLTFAGDFLRQWWNVWRETRGVVGSDNPLWSFNLPLAALIVVICAWLAFSTSRWVHAAGVFALLVTAHIAFGNASIR